MKSRHSLSRVLRLLGAGFLLLPLGAVAAAGIDPRDRVELMADALRARAAGDLDEAEAKLSALLALAPGDPHVTAMLEALRAERSRPVVVPPPARDAGDDAAVAGGRDGHGSAGGRSDDRGELLRRARAQEIAGDLLGAQETLSRLVEQDPADEEAVRALREVDARVAEAAGQSRRDTREGMLEEVGRGWQRPAVFERTRTADDPEADNALEEKLERIILPKVSFSGLPLSRAVDTLAALSEEYDPEGEGVNMVLIDPGGHDPRVSITLRGLSLARVLDFTTESVGYGYDVQRDAVVVRVGEGGGSRLETEFFPLSRSTLIRLTGVGPSPGAAATPTHADPFAAPEPSAGPRAEGEEAALKHFLQRAGVPFDPIEGANLALADGQLIVTTTPRLMEKVRNILRRYTEVKQVEIEARFLEVRQGELEELGFEWAVRAGGDPGFDPATGLPLLEADGSQLRVNRDRYATSGRSLEEAFSLSPGENRLRVIGGEGEPIRDPVAPPVIPNARADLAVQAGNLASLTGVMGGAEVDLVIRALSRQTGNDLLSAPKVTVLSGKTAEITVAQELRYPRSYGDIEAQVGRGDSSASGSAGVAITAGTPENFAVRNIGVEMEVTPTVEDDNSISLLLEPRVTEFEGFVEYGGTSVAIASGTTVTVPSGFFQPIFSVRRVRTEVTIWDGATVVMGGLTREQAVAVEDKVPVLGDIPILGRLFQSRGESAEKRNLLVFVTANLISPGGSPQGQVFSAVEPGSLFQQPTFVAPGGAVSREVTRGEE